MIYHNYIYNICIYIYRRTIFKSPIFLVYLETRSPSTPLLHRLAQYNVHSHLKCIAFVQNGSMNIEKLDRQKWGSKWGLLLRFVECFRDLYSLVQNLSRTDAQSWCHLRLMPRMSQAFLMFFCHEDNLVRCFLMCFLSFSFLSDVSCIANGLSCSFPSQATHDGSFPRPEGWSQGSRSVPPLESRAMQ